MNTFKPSTHGFHFKNCFDSQPILKFLGIPIGDAQKGLCGGMTFAALDYYFSGIKVPENTEIPKWGEPLYHYIAGRMIDSIILPWVSLKVYWWSILDDETVKNKTKLLLPELKKHLDEKPVPLSIIFVNSLNPFDTDKNHQVVAYGYAEDRIRIYDVNNEDDDEVYILITENGFEHSHRGYLRGFYETKGVSLKTVV